MSKYQVKKGQRWLWKNTEDSTIVEIMEDKSFDDRQYTVAKCKIVQFIYGHRFGELGLIRNWAFGDNMSNWFYLDGQDSPV